MYSSARSSGHPPVPPHAPAARRLARDAGTTSSLRAAKFRPSIRGHPSVIQWVSTWRPSPSRGERRSAIDTHGDARRRQGESVFTQHPPPPGSEPGSPGETTTRPSSSVPLGQRHAWPLAQPGSLACWPKGRKRFWQRREVQPRRSARRWSCRERRPVPRATPRPRRAVQARSTVEPIDGRTGRPGPGGPASPAPNTIRRGGGGARKRERLESKQQPACGILKSKHQRISSHLNGSETTPVLEQLQK